MSRSIKFFGLAVVAAASWTVQLQAQATKINTDPDGEFKRAKDLYFRGQYALAYPIFKTLNYSAAYHHSNIPETRAVEARFYTLSCSLMLNQLSAEETAKDFIHFEHSTPLVEMLSFQLAEYYFRKENFQQALEYYQSAGTANLNNEETAKLQFHQGYCLFTMQRFEEAAPLFNAIRQMPSSPNYVDANYYYGFIEFYRKNYDAALNSLQIVKDNPSYQKIVPYYIAEIYYFQDQKSKALSYAETSLSGGGQYYETELKQLAGHIYFEQGQYSKALPYLEDYITKSAKVKREDLYELSYCYYQDKQWNKAIEGLKELGGKQDSLAQNSMYLLGDAYLHIGDKSSARNAFLFCSLNSSNQNQKAISTFNYAKLSYELGFQDVALSELKNFVTTYPQSPYNQEARELLVSVLSNTNNYKEALSMIQSLGGAQSEMVQRAYPRILYGRAVELINDQEIAQATRMINSIFNVPYNDKEIQPAYFWKGELAYRAQDYEGAIEALGYYLQQPVTYGEVNESDANYTLGYAYMRAGHYSKALTAFRKVTTRADNGSSNVEKDAYLRAADCYFMQKNYSQASEIYDDIIRQNLPSADYAYYQKAVIAGAYGRVADKVAYLQAFDQQYGHSPLAAEANLQMAAAYMASENFSNAVAPLQKVLSSDQEALKPDAYLNLGVTYYNMGNNQASLESFQQLIKRYPNAAQSDDAIAYVRNIFVNEHQPEKYLTFMQQNGKQVSYSEQDSLSYISAFKSYGSESFDAAVSGFERYLQSFPQGQYNIDASYYLAGLYLQRKDVDNALKYYGLVAAKAPNRFAEEAVLQTARLYYFDKNDYSEAAGYYQQLKAIATSQENRLESMRGLLRCQYKLAQWAEADANARELLTQKGIADDDKQISNTIIAKNLQQQGDLRAAKDAYKKVYALGKSEYAAEARYRVAQILVEEKDYKEAEKAAFDVINKAGSYDYWITKSYILLGDIYFKEDDLFNAEATLKSVVENASDPTIVAEAQEKLDIVLEEKKKKSRVE